MIDDILKDAQQRMAKSIDSMQTEMAKIRTGRANPNLISHLSIDYYGVPTPITQVANITVQDARTLGVQTWEKTMVLPPLTEERRKEMVKVAAAEGENGKVSIRNIRRDANSDFKSLLKDKDISEDEDKQAQDQVQKLTDKYVAEIDVIVKEKEVEILTV